MTSLDLCGGFKDISDLLQNALAVSGVIAAHSRDQAGVEVLFQDDCTDLIESSLGSMNLLDDVNAVFIFFDHALDATQVPLNIFQPM
jgi:hypothetical protein